MISSFMFPVLSKLVWFIIGATGGGESRLIMELYLVELLFALHFKLR